MLQQLVSRLVSNGLADMKRRASGAGLMFFGLLLLVLAATFVFFAIYLWLSARMEPWLAALSVAGIIILLSLILWLAGRAMMRRQRTRSVLMDEEIQTLIRQLSAEGGLGGKKPALSLVAAAALLGLLIGRRSTK
jgi:uncharacterized membrane protein YecN with MAPEG domain